MRPFITRLLSVILLSAFYLAANAQITYNIPVSVSTSSFGTLNSCSNCIINLSPGVVLTINTNVSCTNCTFNGGTVNFSSGSVNLGGTDAFNNDTVLINESLAINSMNFSGAHVTLNSTLTYNSGGTTIANTTITANAALSFNSATLTNDIIDATANVTSGNTVNMTGGAINLHGSSQANLNGSTLTGISIVMDGTNNQLKTGSSLTLKQTDVVMNGSSTLTGSSISVTGGSITSAGTITSGGSVTFNGDTLNMTGGSLVGSSITMQDNSGIRGIFSMSGSSTLNTNGSLTINKNTVNLSGSATLTPNSVSMTTDTMDMAGTSSITSTNSSIAFTSTEVYLAGTAALSANSISLQTNSYLRIGDGSIGSGANVFSKNTPTINASTLAIANNNNYYSSNSSTFSTASGNKSIAGNTISCGGGGTQHSCASNTVFGCATMNGSGALGCVVLATAQLDLSATLSNHDVVNLSWSDPQSTSADNYQIERSANGQSWTPLATIGAEGYITEEYHFEDETALAGTNEYRIKRIDHDGGALYSAITTVTVTRPTATVSIFPNPAFGHTFNITVPTTSPFVLNIYTLTGQLLTRTTLQGQTQYPVRLPAQLLPGTTVIVQTIGSEQTASFPLLLR